MQKQVRNWIHSLVAATIAGGANGITVMIVSPENFNLGSGIGKLGQVVFVGALVGLAMFLKQSPLPPDDAQAAG